MKLYIEMGKTVSLTLLFCLILSYDSLGQLNSWKIGVSGGPTLRNLHVTDRVLWPDGFENEDAEEFSLLGWDVGITFVRTINDKWSISSGTFFSKKGWELNPYRSYNIRTSELIAKTSVLYHFEFLEVPLLLQYGFYKTENLSFSVKGGPSAGWLLSDYRTLNVQWGQPTEVQIEEFHESWDPRNFYYRDFNIGVWLGLEITKSLGKKIEISAEPQFKAFVKDVNDPDKWEYAKIDQERRYLYSFGFNVAVHYKFIEGKAKICGRR